MVVISATTLNNTLKTICQMKIKPANHKKKKKQRNADSRPVDVFRMALNNNKRKNGLAKIGDIIDEIIVTRKGV
jgi:hypothetical protein